jgi:hypothetical protein
VKITEISYRALRTGRGYNNTAVEGRAIVEPDEDPARALAELRFWVDKQVDSTLKIDDAYADLAGVQGRVEYAKREAERYEARTKEARQFISECHELAELAKEHGKGGVALSLQQLL